MGLTSDWLQSRRGKKAAVKANEFSERMSNTAYQRGMADMRKAGLNPILAYKQGGASSPIGQMPHFTSTGDIANTAVQAADVGSKGKTRKSERAVHSSTRAHLAAQTRVATNTAGKVLAEIDETQARTRNHNAEAGINESRQIKAAVEAQFYNTGRGKFNFELNRWLDPIGKAAGLAAGGIAGHLLGKRGRGKGKRGPSSRRGRKFMDEGVPINTRPRR